MKEAAKAKAILATVEKQANFAPSTFVIIGIGILLFVIFIGVARWLSKTIAPLSRRNKTVKIIKRKLDKESAIELESESADVSRV